MEGDKTMPKTRQEYIHQLAALQDKVAVMGEMARLEVSHAMEALLHNDKAQAEKVMAADDNVDHLLVEIEDRCLILTAKQQPLAHDLRIIATALKIGGDLERIGDHAYDIARTVREVDVPLDAERLNKVQELSNWSLAMVAQAMQAYRESDIKLADAVRDMDAHMDKLFEQAFYALSEYVTQAETTQRVHAAQLLFIVRFLSRIGDHAVNIAESTIYLETAQRVHTHKHTADA